MLTNRYRWAPIPLALAILAVTAATAAGQGRPVGAGVFEIPLNALERATQVTISPDGKYLVAAVEVGSGEGPPEVRRWDRATGKRDLVWRAGSPYRVPGLAWSKDGRLIFADYHPAVWLDWPAGTRKYELDRQTREFRDVSRRPPKVVHQFPETVGAVETFFPAAEVVAHYTRGKITLLGYTRYRTATIQLDHDATEHLWPETLNTSADGSRLAGCTEAREPESGHDAWVWDVKTGKQVAKVRFVPKRSVPGAEAFARLSRDGTWLVTGVRDWTREVDVWEVTTGKKVRTLAAPHRITRLAVSPGSDRVAAATAGGDVLAWDLATGMPRLAVREGPRKYDDLRFSPDGKSLAWSSGSIIRYVELPGLDKDQ